MWSESLGGVPTIESVTRNSYPLQLPLQCSPIDFNKIMSIGNNEAKREKETVQECKILIQENEK